MADALTLDSTSPASPALLRLRVAEAPGRRTPRRPIRAAAASSCSARSARA